MGILSVRSKPRASASSSPGAPPKQYYRAGSAVSKRSPFEKSNKLVSKKRRFLMLIVNLAIVAVILFGLFYSLILQPEPRIVLNDSSYHTAAVYQRVAIHDLQALRNRNKITFSDNQVTASLKHRFPEIASVKIDLPLLGQKPQVYINVASPSLLLISGQNSYIIDAQGKAVGTASDLRHIASLPQVNDQSGFSPSVGKQLLGADAVSFITTVIAQCKKQGVPIQSLTLPPVAQQLDLRTADRPYFTKFYFGAEPLQQVGQFLAARQEFDAKGSQPSEYLDVRVAGKVFYK